MSAKNVPQKVLVVASMNGSGEAVGPAVLRLRERGSNVLVVSHGGATQAFKKFGIEPDRDLKAPFNPRVCTAIVKKFDPTVILTGTSSYQSKEQPITLEQLFRGIARRVGVRSVAVLDIWGSYLERFSDFDFSEKADPYAVAKIVRRLVHMPDSIAIMDGYARERMLALRFPAEVLSVTGNPYFEYVADVGRKMPPNLRERLLSKPVFSGLHKDGRLVVFISDEVERFYPDIGYTETSVLEAFLRAVNTLAQITGQRIDVIIRPHPFRRGNAERAAAIETPAIRKVVHNPTDPNDPSYYPIEELLGAAHLVGGTFNNPLVTARILGTPVLSFQPGLVGDDLQAYTNERGITTLVTRESDLIELVSRAINFELTQCPIELVDGAIDRVIELFQ